MTRETSSRGVNPAMVDLFAAALLIFASRAQINFDQVPLVQRDSPGQSSSEVTESSELLLSANALELKGEPISWQQLSQHLQAMEVNERLCVIVDTSENGQGPVADLLRVSLMVSDSGKQQQVVVLSKESVSSPQP